MRDHFKLFFPRPLAASPLARAFSRTKLNRGACSPYMKSVSCVQRENFVFRVKEVYCQILQPVKNSFFVKFLGFLQERSCCAQSFVLISKIVTE